MQHATFDAFSAAHDSLKTRCRCKLGNLFLDSASLRGLLAQKKCLLHTGENSLFLLVPYHDAYYDCLYLTEDEPALETDLADLLNLYRAPMDMRGSIIAKEPLAGEVAEIFRRQGFALTKKLLRMRLEGVEQRILEAMRPYADEYRDCMAFAGPGDAGEILKILQEDFDLVADNLPELAVIREHAARQQIAVLRRDDRIASLRYFSFHNNTLHSLYDVTRKEYRREGFFMALAIFVEEHFAAQGKKNLRALGWRDAAKQKLVKHAKKSNQHPDGVVIYNMLRTLPGTNDAKKAPRP